MDSGAYSIRLARRVFYAHVFASVCRWCHDIGREHAANRPLLKTVFQVHNFILKIEFDTAWFLLCLS